MSILKNNLRMSGSSVRSGERSTDSKIINWVCMAFLAGLIFLGRGGAKAAPAPYNVLINPGAETGDLTGWNVSNTGYTLVVSTNSLVPGTTTENYLAHSGKYVFELFDTTANSAYIWQDYAAVAGSEWSANCYAICYASNYFDSAIAYMEVAFFDTNNNLLGASFDDNIGPCPAPFEEYGYGVYGSAILDPNVAKIIGYPFEYIIAPPPAVDASGWMYLPATNFYYGYTNFGIGDVPIEPGFVGFPAIEYGYQLSTATTNLVAPPGTAFVRYKLEFDNGSDDGGAVYWDDCVLAKLTWSDPDITNPQPASVTIYASGSASFTVKAVAAHKASIEVLTYQWQKNGTDLPPAGGVNDIVGVTTNATLAFVNCAGTDSGLYSCVVMGITTNVTPWVTNGTIRSVPVPLTVIPLNSLPSGMQWNIVWNDEFNQPDGSSPDPTKWDYDIGNGSGGWGNNELEYYTSRTNNARIVGGQLIIEADQESYGGYSYTSARMKTQGKWSWAYGRIEARIKIPRGQGIWPAFWMLGTNIDSVGWPTCGEIDIMENIGKTSDQGTDHGTIHGPQGGGDYNGGSGVGGTYTLPGGAALADDFHIYAVEWMTNQIKWFLDSNNFFTATPSSLPSGGTWVFTAPQFIILNVAVGGNWPGNPDATTVFPQQMLVDYVRVYEPTAPLAFSVGPQSNGSFTLSWPTNIVCHVQVQTNSLAGGTNWFDTSVTTSPLVVSPDPNNNCVFYRLESP